LADQTKANFLGAVSWSFEFENQPWFYGYRDLSTNGVDKPVLNVFRMFGMMTGKRVSAESNRMYPLEEVLKSSVRGELSDIGALATKDKKSAAVMVWNYHDDNIQGLAENVIVTIDNVPAKKAILSIYLIDDTNSNSYEVWKKMGSPQNPTELQIKTLESAGQLKCVSTEKNKINSGQIILNLKLTRQAVALAKITW